jgi:hypothetical protein
MIVDVALDLVTARSTEGAGREIAATRTRRAEPASAVVEAGVPPGPAGRVPLALLPGAMRPERLDGRAGEGDGPPGLVRLGLAEFQAGARCG